VPTWRDLWVDPGAADPTIIAAANFLGTRSDIAGDRFTLVGFSFGATQALVSAARPEVGARIGKVIAFGGYADLERTMLAMMTGEQEWQGRRRYLEPDPYGRWIAAANYLTLVADYSQMHDLASAAHALAVESGLRGAYAGAEEYDGLKEALREGLSLEERELWDLLAPPFGVRASPEPARALARRIARAALEQHPELDPRERLGGLVQPVILAHGYDDRLIPSSETLRLRGLLPRRLEVSHCITRLFSHSREADPLPLLAYPREVASFCKLLNRALSPR
jgi:pimeloyl-ACP methyl ester carboxylesterase